MPTLAQRAKSCAVRMVLYVAQARCAADAGMAPTCQKTRLLMEAARLSSKGAMSKLQVQVLRYNPWLMR
jgi:hypothetical protein